MKFFSFKLVVLLAMSFFVIASGSEMAASPKKHRKSSKKVVKTTTMAQAEAQVIKNGYAELERLFKTRGAECLDYSFDKLQAKDSEWIVVTSPDGNLRYYYWEVYDYKKEPTSNYIWPEEVWFYEQCRLANGKVVTQRLEEFGDRYAHPVKIEQMKTKGGATLYVVTTEALVTHTGSTRNICARLIGKKGCSTVKFVKKGQAVDVMHTGLVMPTTDFENLSKKTVEGDKIYVPVDDSKGIVSGYDIYTFDGKNLVYKNHVK